MPRPYDDRPRIFSPSRWTHGRTFREILRMETTGGLLVLIAATIALVWANLPWSDVYESVRTTRVGPDSLNLGPLEFHLGLTVAQWSADLLLAVFFFVAGIEVKREFTQGDLRDPRRAVVPIAATIGGVVLPALLYLTITAGDTTARSGWAIPTATDIAFALAVLAVVGSHLPSSLRAFLLTLAVIDDLIAITIIAIFFSSDIGLAWLGAALVPIALFSVVARGRRRWWWLLPVLGIVAWLFVHEAGVHATVAGVLLGLTLPGSRRRIDGVREETSVGEVIGHTVQPFSAGIAVPVFAVFAAGVTVTGGGLGSAAGDAVVLGLVLALVLGKSIGIAGGAWLAARFTRARLDERLSWTDVIGVAFVAGVGFTVSLLISELAFGTGTDRTNHARIGVLAGSLIAATIGALILRRRDRHYRATSTRT